MEITTVSCVLGVAAICLFYIWRILNWLWFRPKKMEKFLKDQGLQGTPYRLLYGDLKEIMQMMNEAISKPMNLTHDIGHRASPFYHKSLTTIGMKLWFFYFVILSVIK
ncbi:putative secologanin synthase [Helianthus annuus]|nr:putative secologanin synthase [Helianthus annuus]KAJ0505051.1 putative secologanin synthase [Helianthus annuus]KAJ0674736.1 putative secologanin synthase [Helianthus annuus]KAJ0678088.1 putative secologanin synthase [Helianthus annuus]KAJ0866224.1 putative secologanin synthase [Helianthus annuus]